MFWLSQKILWILGTIFIKSGMGMFGNNFDPVATPSIDTQIIKKVKSRIPAMIDGVDINCKKSVNPLKITKLECLQNVMNFNCNRNIIDISAYGNQLNIHYISIL